MALLLEVPLLCKCTFFCFFFITYRGPLQGKGLRHFPSVFSNSEPGLVNLPEMSRDRHAPHLINRRKKSLPSSR